MGQRESNFGHVGHRKLLALPDELSVDEGPVGTFVFDVGHGAAPGPRFLAEKDKEVPLGQKARGKEGKRLTEQGHWRFPLCTTIPPRMHRISPDSGGEITKQEGRGLHPLWGILASEENTHPEDPEVLLAVLLIEVCVAPVCPEKAVVAVRVSAEPILALHAIWGRSVKNFFKKRV